MSLKNKSCENCRYFDKDFFTCNLYKDMGLMNYTIISPKISLCDEWKRKADGKELL